MPDVFYKLTFGQFQLNAEGYQIRECREWERARFIAAAVHQSVGQEITPKELIDLKTDHVYTAKARKDAPKPMTKHEVANLMQLWKK